MDGFFGTCGQTTFGNYKEDKNKDPDMLEKMKNVFHRFHDKTLF